MLGELLRANPKATNRSANLAKSRLSQVIIPVSWKGLLFSQVPKAGP